MLSGAPYSADRLVALLRPVGRRHGVRADRRAAGSASSMTHPANWTEFQLHLLTQRPSTRSGSATSALLTEPQAAAIDFAAVAQRRPRRDRTSSTTSVAARSTSPCCARRRTGSPTSAKPAGVERLGGIDFDEAVFQHVIDQLPADVVEQRSRRPRPGAWRSASSVGHASRPRRGCPARSRSTSRSCSRALVDGPPHPRRVRGDDPADARQTIDLSGGRSTGPGSPPRSSAGDPARRRFVADPAGLRARAARSSACNGRVDAHPKLVVARGAARWAATAAPSGRVVEPRPGAGRNRRVVIGAVAAVVVLGGGAALRRPNSAAVARTPTRPRPCRARRRRPPSPAPRRPPPRRPPPRHRRRRLRQRPRPPPCPS